MKREPWLEAESEEEEATLLAEEEDGNKSKEIK